MVNQSRTKTALEITGAAIGVVVLILLLWFGVKAAHRYQVRADRTLERQQNILNQKNQVRVNDIKIAQTAQLVKVEQQKAQIRVQDAIGIRDSQAIINKTLTPLYLQHEAIGAQLEMAHSENHTLLWIPSGANGVPTVDLAQLTRN
jgi:hypothetical protein